MYPETEKAIAILKQIEDIDFEIEEVYQDESNCDIIKLNIHEPNFEERLRLKHVLIERVFEKLPLKSERRFFIFGAI